jgi:hypothetical protein
MMSGADIALDPIAVYEGQFTQVNVELRHAPLHRS